VLAGRNNLGVVSINLPRIAIEAEQDRRASSKFSTSAWRWPTRR
jgi:anaerobic ribonucleoside-triphosphate reductase